MIQYNESNLLLCTLMVVLCMDNQMIHFITLQGTFSRYDYQRTPTHAAIKSFKVALPASARDVYYRDAIGNISTSNMLIQEDAVEVELRPRFPLFGGWKTQYYIGYNVPAYEYLYNIGLHQ